MIPGASSRWLAVLLAASLAACTQPADPFEIPTAAAVERITFTQWDGLSSRSRVHIVDRTRIERILAQLRTHNAGYYRRRLPFGPGEPTDQQYTIAVGGSLSVPLVLWIGSDWLGGVDTKAEADGWRQARYRTLGVAERRDILALFTDEMDGESGAQAR